MKWLEPCYRLQRLAWQHLRPRTRGVKVMLFDAGGRILLIRNAYGRSDLFVLPGGGVRPWERLERAAAREIREELGCGVDRLTLVSVHASIAEGKRDTIHLFTGLAVGEPVADGVELAEAAFFPLDALPEATSPATQRRIAEWLEKRAVDGSW